MKKLTAEMSKEHDDIFGKLKAANDSVEDVINKINRLIGTELSDAVEHYNEVIQEANTFRDEVVAKMEDYIEEQSEKWGDSEAGSSYAEWKDTWECADLESMDRFDELSNSADQDIADNFGSLDMEPK